jgi:hypothetical protein
MKSHGQSADVKFPLRLSPSFFHRLKERAAADRASVLHLIATAVDEKLADRIAPSPPDKFLNELMIIAGECELLQEEMLDVDMLKRIGVIRETAVRMSRQIVEDQARQTECPPDARPPGADAATEKKDTP